jgi:drug/metabolite transporter (DMT)-like permease
VLEVEPTGSQRSICGSPIPQIGFLLVIVGPVATTVAGLLSREEGRSATPFYVLWLGSLAVGIALVYTAVQV